MGKGDGRKDKSKVLQNIKPKGVLLTLSPPPPVPNEEYVCVDDRKTMGNQKSSLELLVQVN
jgi:hypothetical protein